MALYTDYRAKSFWLEQAGADYAESPAVEGLIRADVLIVGGGFAGLSAAYHLKKAEPGMRVVLLESDVVGYGASGRSAGLVTASFGLSPSAALARFGRHKALEARRYMERAVSYLGEFIQHNRLNCDYETAGCLRVATTPACVRRIQKELAFAQSMAIAGMQWLDAQAARALVNSPTYLGAWLDPIGALVNPAKLARGLKRVAARFGAEIYEHSPVTQIDVAPRVRAQTPRGAVEAEKMVLATNAYTSQFPQLRSRQFPIHSYIVLTEPLDQDQLGSLRWRGRQGVEDARNLAYYYRLTADNRLLVGGGDYRYVYGNQTGVDRYAPAFDRLERFMGQTFPSLRGIRMTHRWGGVVSGTFDFAPVIGAAGKHRRVVYDAGGLGHGLALSFLNGRVMSELALEQRTDLTDVFFARRATIPLPPEPLRWPLVNGALGVMRLQDRWHERNGLGAR